MESVHVENGVLVTYPSDVSPCPWQQAIEEFTIHSVVEE